MIAYAGAKWSINQDRAAKAKEDIEWRKQQAKLRENEAEYRQYVLGKNGKGMTDESTNPSAEAAADPAATRHAPTTEGQRVLEKSKYEASEVWRSPKGDRFV